MNDETIVIKTRKQKLIERLDGVIAVLDRLPAVHPNTVNDLRDIRAEINEDAIEQGGDQEDLINQILADQRQDVIDDLKA